MSSKGQWARTLEELGLGRRLRLLHDHDLLCTRMGQCFSTMYYKSLTKACISFYC